MRVLVRRESLGSASIPQKMHELAAAAGVMHQSELGASDAQSCASGAPFVERSTRLLVTRYTRHIHFCSGVKRAVGGVGVDVGL